MLVDIACVTVLCSSTAAAVEVTDSLTLVIACLIAVSAPEILVCRDDFSVQRELDHGLRTAKRIKTGLRITTDLAIEHLALSRTLKEEKIAPSRLIRAQPT